MSEMLQQLVGDNHSIHHLKDFYDEGTLDPVWIPRLAAESGWIVITSDRGKNKPNRGKLPELMRQFKITHIAMSQKIHELPQREKVGILATIWDEIVEKANAVPGTAFLLRYQNAKNDKNQNVMRIVLQEILERKPKTKRNVRPTEKKLEPKTDKDIE